MSSLRGGQLLRFRFRALSVTACSTFHLFCDILSGPCNPMSVSKLSKVASHSFCNLERRTATVFVGKVELVNLAGLLQSSPRFTRHAQRRA